MTYFIEVLVAGLLAGVMYSLVALGFVLIYKASGVFNFAQGAMVLFAALTFVSVRNRGVPFWFALVIAMAAMVLLAILIERLVLRPLANQPPMSLFMATIGLTIVIEGISQLMYGSKAHQLDLGIRDVPFEVLGIGISKFDLFAAAVAGTLVLALVIFFHRTATGRALRAVADDHQAAMSIGISLTGMWRYVWALSGGVALVAGLLWGSRLGVQFGLVVVALKALPVLILGGFTSISGAIVGGVIIGAAEKLAEIYLGRSIGGGIENWFPYVLAMLFLMVRPNGLFGEHRIERV